jgi:phage terminase small subunit
VKLTPKQKKFADLFIKSGNATQSYIDAGYKATKKSVAEANARKLLGEKIYRRTNEIQRG